MVLRSAPAISSSLTTVCVSSSCACRRSACHPVVHVIRRMFLSKLPKQRARTEDCAADTQVCRTVCHGGLKIGAHPCGDPGGRGVISTHSSRHGRELRESLGRIHPQRGNRHQSSKREMLCSSNAARPVSYTHLTL